PRTGVTALPPSSVGRLTRLPATMTYCWPPASVFAPGRGERTTWERTEVVVPVPPLGPLAAPDEQPPVVTRTAAHTATAETRRTATARIRLFERRDNCAPTGSRGAVPPGCGTQPCTVRGA